LHGWKEVTPLEYTILFDLIKLIETLSCVKKWGTLSISLISKLMFCEEHRKGKRKEKKKPKHLDTNPAWIHAIRRPCCNRCATLAKLVHQSMEDTTSMKSSSRKEKKEKLIIYQAKRS